MCDTLCGPGSGGMVFAKNSDRPIGEVQIAVPFGRRASAGGTLRTQYLSIGDTGAHGALLSCPTWLWGAEHGVNEHAVAIGNEKVSTTHDAASAKPSLIGMDLVRLGLERGRSAEEALDVLIDLVATHGQGGIADATHHEAYDSSFLIADPSSAYILETAGREYAAAPAPSGAALSNRLALGTGWTRGSDSLDSGDDFDQYRDPRQPTGFADVRLAASQRFLDSQQAAGIDPRAAVAHLRDHGHGPWGAPGAGDTANPAPTDVGEDFSGVSVCMHVRQRAVTTASLVAVLPADVAEGAPVQAYVALGSPCVSVYVPAFPFTAAGPPEFVPRELSRESLWHCADQLRQWVETDPDAIHTIRQTLDPVEAELWSEADEVRELPHVWSSVGASWGQRALDAMTACLP